VDPPDLLIAYFYEGNDLEDTLAELLGLTILETPALAAYSDANGTLRLMLEDRQHLFDHALQNLQLRDPEHLRELIAHRYLPRHDLHGKRGGSLHEFFFARFLVALVEGEIAMLRGQAPVWAWEEGINPPGENRVDLAGSVTEVPGSLQAPGMELTSEETDLAFYAAQFALGELVASFPDTEVCLLRVPSPANLYEFRKEPVSVQGLRAISNFPSAEIRARSEAVEVRLREIADRLDARFVDALLPLREAARTELIHGPRDWMHLNRRGQTVLGEVAVQCLARPPRS
jgi:hypothetical protein